MFLVIIIMTIITEIRKTPFSRHADKAKVIRLLLAACSECLIFTEQPDCTGVCNSCQVCALV